ncbi:MAG TPA: hypothetical protein VFL83_16565 [Anaeromyxobacter sp.]|nr:hypothetical protein [Anaeromyxobacter sp.]
MRRLLRTAPAALAAAALACATAGPRRDAPLPAGLDDGAARAALERFARDLQEGRFEDAHRLLSARWRDAYTPGRLAMDFGGGGPAVREAAARVRAALSDGGPIERDGPRARLPVGEGRAAVLVAEGGGWRVDAIE